MSRTKEILNTLRDSILDGDWEGVVHSYYDITGEELPIPVSEDKELTIMDELEEIVESPEKFVTEEKVEPEVQTRKDGGEYRINVSGDVVTTPIKSLQSGRSLSGTQAIGDRSKVVFIDIPGHRRKEAKEAKKLVIEKEKRAPSKLYDVTCNNCGKQEKVTALFLPKKMDKGDKVSQYSCNKCIVGRK